MSTGGIYKIEITNEGERITMLSGAVWFHPFNGGAPRLEKQSPAIKAALESGKLVIIKG